MKIRTLSLPIFAAGMLLGCNPTPAPPVSPNNNVTTLPETTANLGSMSNSTTVAMDKVSADGVGENIGVITVYEDTDGVTFRFALTGFSEGEYGFHVHQNPSCEPAMNGDAMQAAGAAGGHYDPENIQLHMGPTGQGHHGDLAMLRVDNNGVQHEVTSTRLKLSQLQNRSLVVHQQVDDYKTDPAGNSGPRIACGVIKYSE
ncbi:superoxide dismutase family protein [Arsukibacterium sp. MJ3]|uniref:superoxide dismutase family protein n=1 Tax=Arsukibacterium sp. MJ3 TaxID=1632859 RepID=UPI00069BBD48|nr:superoxide dismutase family protein [Arsukibacterium sp. MJ3]